MKRIVEKKEVGTYQMIVNILLRLRHDMNSDGINSNFRDDLKSAIKALEIVKTYY